jgi:hypothetical protein
MADAERNKQIKWMNALNNACLLVAHGKLSIVETVWESEIKGIAEAIYALEAPN